MFLIHVPFIIVLLFAYAIIGQWSIKKVAIHLIFKGHRQRRQPLCIIQMTSLHFRGASLRFTRNCIALRLLDLSCCLVGLFLGKKGLVYIG